MKVLKAISHCQSTLTTKIEEVKVDISLIQQHLQKLRERVKQLQTRLCSLDDVIPRLQHSLDHLQLQVNQLLQKQDDMENRLHCCNLRFIGLLEGSEGANPPFFLKQLSITTYEPEAFSSTFMVEMSHCMSARSPPQGAPPCAFIVKMLNYKDRNVVLRLLREKGNTLFGSIKISVFPDLPRVEV